MEPSEVGKLADRTHFSSDLQCEPRWSVSFEHKQQTEKAQLRRYFAHKIVASDQRSNFFTTLSPSLLSVTDALDPNEPSTKCPHPSYSVGVCAPQYNEHVFTPALLAGMTRKGLLHIVSQI